MAYPHQNFVSPPSPTYVVSDGSGKLRSHTLNSDRNFVAQQPRHALPPAPTSARIPIPTPASTPVPPMTPHHTTPKDQMHPMIISSRPHVGRPDYKLHPQFVRPGSFIPFVLISGLTQHMCLRNSRLVYKSPG